jgi:hypothetical protein
MSQEELSLLARGTFASGLIGSITLPNEKRAALIGTLESAEHFAHRLDDDELRMDVISHSLLINGNERRKTGDCDGAEYFLSKAERWARNGHLWRRVAEIAGLQCYAHAARGDTHDLRASLKRSEAALHQAGTTETAGSGSVGAGYSIFDLSSIAEVQLRCALISQDKTWIKRLCREIPSHFPENPYWELYYSLARGSAQLWLRDPEGIHWLRHARDIAARAGMVSQLQRILLVTYGIKSAESSGLADQVYADLEHLQGDNSLPPGGPAWSWRQNLF